MPGRKNASITLMRSRPSNRPITSAANNAPHNPMSSHGTRCQKRRYTASSLVARATEVLVRNPPSREILLVLGEQHRNQPMRGNHSHESTLLVDDRERRLAVLHGTPRGDFLVDTGRHDWRVAVHQRSDRHIGLRAQDIFNRDNTDKSAPLADDEVTRALVAAAGEHRSRVARAKRGRRDRHIDDGMSGGGFEIHARRGCTVRARVKLPPASALKLPARRCGPVRGRPPRVNGACDRMREKTVRR